MLSSHLTVSSPMSQGKQSGWTYLRMRNNLRAVLQPQAEALQITALLFRSDALQSHRDQARTPLPMDPGKYSEERGFHWGWPVSRGGGLQGGTMSLAQWEPNGYEDSQLQELGAAALKPWAGLPGGGSPAGAPYLFSVPRNTGPKKATDHLQLRESRPPADPALRPALRTGRSPRKAAPLHGSAAHGGPARAQGQLQHGGLG